MDFKKITVPSVRQAFVQAIEDQILSGELKVGERLPPARQLCEKMGVSLTVVNAGMSELASKGFVEIKPRHGTYVADYRMQGTTEMMIAMMRFNGGDLNKRDARSFCESRKAVDPMIVDCVMKRAGDERLAELTPIIEKLRTERELTDFCALVTDFFQKMYELSDNSLMYLLYHSTVLPQHRLYARYIEANGWDVTLRFLNTIYEALIHREAERAKQALLDMINLALEGPTSIAGE